MTNKHLTPQEEAQIKKLRAHKDQDLIKRLIIDRTDSRIKDPFSDKELDNENTKRQLLSSIQNFWTIKEVGINILKKPSDYEAIFPQEFYQEIYRLNGWSHKGKIAQKPWKVGNFTNEIIYYRFSNEILPVLRIVNPFIIPGFRKYKHHQYLTTGGRIELANFIQQAINTMKECQTWDEFRALYHRRYNVPYQLKMSF